MQALQAKTDSDQYHGASGDLQHHEKAAHTALARSADGDLSVQRSREIRSRSVQAGQQACRQSHQENDCDHHRQNREVRPEIQSNRQYTESRNKWLEVDQASEAVRSKYKAGHSSHHRNHYAVDKKLANKTHARGAERGTYQNFLPSRTGQRQ